MRMPLALLRLLSIGATALPWLCGCVSTPYAKAVVISESYDPKSKSGHSELKTAYCDAEKVKDMLSKLNKDNKGRIALSDHVNSMSQNSLDEVVHQFEQSPHPAIALVYVAAHGFQSDGHTYFVGAAGESVDAEDFMSKIMKTATGSIFLLDICRTSGKPTELEPAATRLYDKSALVLFASSAGTDDSGGYGPAGSPFARAIVKEFAQKQELRLSLRNMVVDVNKDTGPANTVNATRPVDAADAAKQGKPQNPWPYGLITFDVFLAGRPAWGGEGP